jgi:prepilin-type N-terminal cleavage/methylation domain-containing protein
MVPPRAPSASRARERGFTLIELMTVVLVVGVLAVVAYAGYHKFVVSSHQTEANAILSGIKNRQEAYKAETGQYLNVSKDLAANQGTGFAALYPHCQGGVAAPGAFNVAWSTTPCPASCCNISANADWLKLKVESNAPTFYGYTTVAGTTGVPTNTITISGHAPNWPSGNLSPWFVATAVGDTDGNGVYSTLMISSFDNSVYVDNDNE